MRSIKFFVLTLVVLMIWWLVEQGFNELTSPGFVSIKERLKDLGGRLHAAVGTVAIVIVLILLVRLIVQVATCR